MRLKYFCLVTLVVYEISLINAQTPPRFSVPGAVLVGQAKPSPFRRTDSNPPPRLRKPLPNAFPSPARESVRPVIEEPEDTEDKSVLDDEVSRLGISALQTAVQQAGTPESEDVPIRQPPPFRPERPLPVLRQDIRDSPQRELPALRPGPIFRQDDPPVRYQPPPQPIRQAQQVRQQVSQPQPIRQAPRSRPPPPQYIDDSDVPRREQVAQPQPIRQVARPRPVPPQYNDDSSVPRRERVRKPPVQILRKYRTDNEDGSITWGFENDDGTFKEENIGADCVSRGKYGYIDPDGVRREYSYETGNKCDQPEELPEELALQDPQAKSYPKKPHRLPN